jgi:glutathione S-transferase
METMDYVPLEQVIAAKGLRLVLVKGLPSPWGQAAKTLFELKRVPFICAPQIPGDPNLDLVRWSGQGSGPVVAWEDEKPINHWLDILFLAERIAPEPRMIPESPRERAMMIGLSHEICGEGGIGWSAREMMFAPAIESGATPDSIQIMAKRYQFDMKSAKAAQSRAAGSLGLLAEQLKAQRAAGNRFFVGGGLTALDLYWTAFSVLVAPPPDSQCPIPPSFRPAFEDVAAKLKPAIDPILVEHRDAVFAEFFTPRDY